MLPDHIVVGPEDRPITVHVGELLFPALVLVVSALYYYDTRGLPEQSLLYAEPVLYVTVLLAVITAVQHGFSRGEPGDPMADGVGGRPTDVDSLDEQRDAEQPGDDRLGDEQPSPTESSSPYFNRAAAAALAALTTGYVTVLAVLSAFVTDITFVGLSAAFIGATLYLFGERQWPRLVAYSVGFALLVWGVFVHWLRVPIA